MASPDQSLPEGTNSIIDPVDAISPDPGSGATAADIVIEPATPGAKARLKAAAKTVEEKTAGIRGQASEKARAFAVEGKDRAVNGLDSVRQLIDDAASTIDDKVGVQYGDYARKASEAVSGFASNLQGKEIDDLVADARNAVKKSPALAIGAAAALGFIVARLIKSGAQSAADQADAMAGSESRTAKTARRKTGTSDAAEDAKG